MFVALTILFFLLFFSSIYFGKICLIIGQALSSYKWKPVEATILKSELIEKPNLFGNSINKLHLLYRYKVDGVSYLNSSIGFRKSKFKKGDSTTGENYHLHNQLKVGNITTIYIHPKYPALAVIKRGISKELVQSLLLLAFCTSTTLLVGIILYHYFYSQQVTAAN